MALPVNDWGTEPQKRELLPAFAGSDFVPGSVALVEPRMQWDPFRPSTRARREGDSYVIDGEKCFVPWIEGGSHVLVIATEGDAAQAYVVPRDVAGLRATPERNMGVDALPMVELALEGVRVPASARLGGEAGSDTRQLVNRGRVALAACGVGVARASFEIARDYAKEREAFGAPIATKQAIAFKLADMAIEIDAARLLIWEAAWMLDRGEDTTREATLAYDQVQRTALDAADGAVQVLGGHGYIREYFPEMHLRNARGFACFEALALV